jgi:hypothetical protein
VLIASINHLEIRIIIAGIVLVTKHDDSTIIFLLMVHDYAINILLIIMYEHGIVVFVGVRGKMQLHEWTQRPQCTAKRILLVFLGTNEPQLRKRPRRPKCSTKQLVVACCFPLWRSPPPLWCVSAIFSAPRPGRFSFGQDIRG